MVTRRQIVLALGGGTLAPLAAFAQKVWRIGVLHPTSASVGKSADRFGAIVIRLRELGYVEGRNVAFEWRFAEGNYDRLQELASELVRAKVDLIVTTSTTAALAAHRATTTIPIVTAAMGDPLQTGVSTSLAHPSRNITGLVTMGEVLYPKRLEILTDIAPNAIQVAFLSNPSHSFYGIALSALQRRSKELKRGIYPVHATTAVDLSQAFINIKRMKINAVVVQDDPFFDTQSAQIADLALRSGILTIHSVSQYPEAGGLMSYGRNIVSDYRQSAEFIDKILRGAKPADLPIEQPTKFDFVINMKTAKALGIKIPQSILVQATKVIE